MKYLKTITSLFFLNISIVILLLYFANTTRFTEKENILLKDKILNIEDQININEIEYSLYSGYKYLKKMQKIYFNESENNNFDKRVSFEDIKNQTIEIFQTVGIKKF